ncbi:hypothetical protein BDZ91DRAFT_758635 [Kalaharituber pfeilii]|nr:hypothetical protein BDZ91DRAFT_758635 [Kalaharituber pfeilii]
MAEQPEFNVVAAEMVQISNSHASLAVQFERMQNMPVIAAENRILRAINEVRDQLSEQIHRVHSEINMYARLNNSRIIHENVPLFPLYGQDNQPVAHFPLTIAHLRGLDNNQINKLFQAFGLPLRDEELEIKRRSFGQYIGLITVL